MENVKETEYYERLGVTPTSSSSEIKKAYYKLAQIWHPDRVDDEKKQEASEKFKEISEAYEVLSDDEKRKIYNKHGREGLSQSGFHASNPFDFLSKIFEEFGGDNGGNPQDRGVSLRVTLADLYKGRVKHKTIKRTTLCKQCNGLGSENEKYKGGVECSTCEGKGAVLRMARNGPMIYQFRQDCPDCQGSGHNIPESDLCPSCKGKKVTTEEKRFTIEIQRGMEYNEHISFFGESDHIPGQPTANLVFVLQPKEGDPSPFKRQGNDLFLDQEVPLVGALTGHRFKVVHLDDREVVLETPGIIRPEEVLKIPGLGMPIKNEVEKFGDLYVKFHVIFPTELTEEQTRILLEIFPRVPLEVKEGVEVFQCEKIVDKEESVESGSEDERPCNVQ